MFFTFLIILIYFSYVFSIFHIFTHVFQRFHDFPKKKCWGVIFQFSILFCVWIIFPIFCWCSFKPQTQGCTRPGPDRNFHYFVWPGPVRSTRTGFGFLACASKMLRLRGLYHICVHLRVRVITIEAKHSINHLHKW